MLLRDLSTQVGLLPCPSYLFPYLYSHSSEWENKVIHFSAR